MAIVRFISYFVAKSKLKMRIKYFISKILLGWEIPPYYVQWIWRIKWYWFDDEQTANGGQLHQTCVIRAFSHHGFTNGFFSYWVSRHDLIQTCFIINLLSEYILIENLSARVDHLTWESHLHILGRVRQTTHRGTVRYILCFVFCETYEMRPLNFVVSQVPWYFMTGIITMVYSKIALSPLLTHWRHCSLALSHWYTWYIKYETDKWNPIAIGKPLLVSLHRSNMHWLHWKLCHMNYHFISLSSYHYVRANASFESVVTGQASQ